MICNCVNPDPSSCQACAEPEAKCGHKGYYAVSGDVDARLCPTCSAPMEKHGLSYVCPKQRAEEMRAQAIARANPVTEATKARGRALTEARVAGVDF